MISKNKVYKSKEIINYYLKNRNSWKKLYKSEKEVLKKVFTKKKVRVLDIGCAGAGLFLILNKIWNIKQYQGVEINRTAVEVIKKKIKRKNFSIKNIDFLKFSKNKKFDYVFSFSAIDWNYEFKRMLLKAWFHVKLGGFLVITLRLVKNKKKNLDYQYINFKNKKRGEKAYYQVMTFKNFLNIINKLNFEVSYFNGYWGTPSSTSLTKYKNIYFLCFAIQKSKLKRESISFDSKKKIFKSSLF